MSSVIKIRADTHFTSYQALSCDVSMIIKQIKQLKVIIRKISLIQFLDVKRNFSFGINKKIAYISYSSFVEPRSLSGSSLLKEWEIQKERD